MSRRDYVLRVPSYDVSIFMGAREGYNGPEFFVADLTNHIQEFQKSQSKYCGVSISRFEFIAARYTEPGFEIRILNYPRFPFQPYDIERFAFSLAASLMTRFNQNRISIVTPDDTHMLESPTAQENP